MFAQSKYCSAFVFLKLQYIENRRLKKENTARITVALKHILIKLTLISETFDKINLQRKKKLINKATCTSHIMKIHNSNKLEDHCVKEMIWHSD